jgi:hypothetical protein
MRTDPTEDALSLAERTLELLVTTRLTFRGELSPEDLEHLSEVYDLASGVREGLASAPSSRKLDKAREELARILDNDTWLPRGVQLEPKD